MVDKDKGNGCKNCCRQFVGDHNLKTIRAAIPMRIGWFGRWPPVGGIRDICHITGYSRGKVQAALKRSTYQISPKRTHYQTLQMGGIELAVGVDMHGLYPAVGGGQSTAAWPFCPAFRAGGASPTATINPPVRGTACWLTACGLTQPTSLHAPFPLNVSIA